MDSTEITVAYIDETGAWPSFKQLIQSIFPIKDIEFQFEIGKFITKNLKVGFLSENDQFYANKDSWVYYDRAPYVNLCIVTCPTKEKYTESIKNYCQNFVSRFDGDQKWMLIFTTEKPINTEDEFVDLVDFDSILETS